MSALGAASLVWLAAEVWHVTWHRQQLDFSVYVMGAHHLVDGKLYTASLDAVPALPFTYPPVAAVAFGPLALLPRSVAQLAWAGVNMASLYAVLALSLRAVLPGTDRVRIALWALVLLGPSYLIDPVRLTFYFGQVNLVLCAMVLADLTITIRLGRRTLPRGVLVGVAAAVKLVPLVFIPYLFVTRQVRAAWTASASFAVCSLVAVALDPAASWDYWTKYVTDGSRVGNPYFILDQSLQGTLDRLAHRQVSTALVYGLGAVGLVAGIALARWAWRDSSPFLGILVAATTGLIVSPITWEHHLVWAVPVLVWLACAPDRPPVGWLWAVGAGAVLWWAPLQHVPSAGTDELHEHGWTLVAGNSFFVLLVAFMIGITVMLAVRGRSTHRDGTVNRQPDPASTAAAPT
jgi:alpha-1,2-mannosyltransferase